MKIASEDVTRLLHRRTPPESSLWLLFLKHNKGTQFQQGAAFVAPNEVLFEEIQQKCYSQPKGSIASVAHQRRAV
jgi:hypothetical protein